MEQTPSSTQDDINSPNSNSTISYFGSSQFTPSLSTTNTTTYRCPSLTTFLHQLNLSQYHHLFAEAGVGENDLEQLIGFDEAELKEVMSAISMKPFHSAAFKKGVRELRQTLATANVYHHNAPLTFSNISPLSPLQTSMSVQHLQQIQNISTSALNVTPGTNMPDIINAQSSKDVIIHHATIYGKNSRRQLTTYEQAINQAAIELALSDPALVANKGALFERAKAKLLLEGYNYKRGQSRSKLNPNAPKPGVRASKSTIREKRNAHAAITSENRQINIAELERKLKIKETQLDLAQEIRGAKTQQGDQLGLEKAQLSLEEIEQERNEIAKELSVLKNKEPKMLKLML
ncbi:10934_t:CDS:2 [Entrophospora sp. SA101]|nr:10934_t:CDS:2 [Entrophospora sp. SA101]